MDFEVHRVTEHREGCLTLVFSTVLHSDRTNDIGGVLVWDEASVMEPLGRIVPRGVGGLAPEGHTVVLEYPDPFRV